jgi:hypothetical protein
MSAWIISIIDGLLTGIGLYALVRLRMYLGPIADRKLGIWGRRAVWVLLIAAMVIVAELDLTWLRDWLEEANAPGTRWYYEAVYAATFLAVGLALVRWRVLKRPSKQGEQPNAQRDDTTSNSRRTQ